MEKVYCKECRYMKVWGATAPSETTCLCTFPVNNWFSPESPWDGWCNKKNKDNQCKDFREKLPSQKMAEDRENEKEERRCLNVNTSRRHGNGLD